MKYSREKKLHKIQACITRGWVNNKHVVNHKEEEILLLPSTHWVSFPHYGWPLIPATPTTFCMVFWVPKTP